MIKVLVAPTRYVQGEGVLAEAGKHIAPLGKRALIIWDKVVRDIISEQLEAGLREHNVEPLPQVFSGECSHTQESICTEKAREVKADVVIGAGGGKAIDLAKAVAFNVGAKMVSLPTVASNDAPTSAASVFYTDEGVLDDVGVWPRNPDLVLVDTKVISGAPVRWLVSGIGDALATWFEAEASFKARRQAFAGGVPTMTGMALARLCYDTLMEYGLDAKMAAEKHVVTPALDKVIEANVLLSGLGWESGGLATAHTLGNSLTIVEATHSYSHGEKVAFGIVTQLILDPDILPAERTRVVDFMVRVGLPVTFKEIGLDKLSSAELMELAEHLTAPSEFVHNHVFPVTAYNLYSAMVTADAFGRSRKQALSREQ